MKATHLTIVSLLSNPMLQGKDIAKIAGVSPQTVSGVKKRLEQALEQNQVAVGAYQNLLRDQVPAELRLGKLKSLIQFADRDATSLQAIQYVDSLLRLTPQTQPGQQDTDLNKPIFNLPTQTNVQVNVTVNQPTTGSLGLDREAYEVEAKQVDSE